MLNFSAEARYPFVSRVLIVSTSTFFRACQATLAEEKQLWVAIIFHFYGHTCSANYLLAELKINSTLRCAPLTTLNKKSPNNRAIGPTK
jgi:hypothetical protein